MAWTGLAEASCRALLAWLAATRVVTVVEAIVDPDNDASMALANRLGFRDAGSITKHQADTGDRVQRRRLTLEYPPWRDATPTQGDSLAPRLSPQQTTWSLAPMAATTRTTDVLPTIYLGSCAVSGDVIHRLAVKAIAFSEGNVLLFFSPAVGSYKFPGGGVIQGEDVTEALTRELEEECGRAMVELGEEMLVVIERRPALDRPGAMSEMESRYFMCVVGQAERTQHLDEYQQELGLRPEWVPLPTAIQVNQQAVDGDHPPPRVARELRVLRWMAGGTARFQNGSQD